MTFKEYSSTLSQVVEEVDPRAVQSLADTILDCYREDRWVFIIGNGGSGANASHFCEDLGKGTLSSLEDQKRLKVLSLTDNTPYLLAWANDEGYDRIFVEQLKNLRQPGALLIAISGSGNSENVLQAVRYANDHGMRTFGITGFEGGQLAVLAQQKVTVPSNNMGLVEAAHSILFHYVLEDLYERFKTSA
jgi:D-sedoheptulose 7-phosphate isomerase